MSKVRERSRIAYSELDPLRAPLGGSEPTKRTGANVEAMSENIKGMSASEFPRIRKSRTINMLLLKRIANPLHSLLYTSADLPPWEVSGGMGRAAGEPYLDPKRAGATDL
jgi:stress-induced morphogen